MRWRSVLRWLPIALFVSLIGGGWLLVSTDLGTPDVVLLVAADGSQVGMLLILLGTAAAIVALVQGVVLAGGLERPPIRVLVRTVCVFLLVLSLPAGNALILMAAFTTVNEYQVLDVPGRHVAVRTMVWHHRSHDVLEGDGLVFHSVLTCPDALALDGYDPFAKGEYDVISRSGHEVLRFAHQPGGPRTGEAILGSRPGDRAASLCQTKK